jgi:hypothetical protein
MLWMLQTNLLNSETIKQFHNFVYLNLTINIHVSIYAPNVLMSILA